MAPPKTAVHLPNEIWDQIVSHSELNDLWVSLRRVNHQLFQCVERHFEQNILPNTVLGKNTNIGFSGDHTIEFYMTPKATGTSDIQYPHQTIFHLTNHKNPRGSSRDQFVHFWNEEYRRVITQTPNRGPPWTVELGGQARRPYHLRVGFVEEKPDAAEARQHIVRLDGAGVALLP